MQCECGGRMLSRVEATMSENETVRKMLKESWDVYCARREAVLLDDLADTSLLDLLVPKLEPSRGTWYPFNRRTLAQEWIPGEQRMSYPTEHECQVAIDRYNERERRRLSI